MAWEFLMHVATKTEDKRYVWVYGESFFNIRAFAMKKLLEEALDIVDFTNRGVKIPAEDYRNGKVFRLRWEGSDYGRYPNRRMVVRRIRLRPQKR